MTTEQLQQNDYLRKLSKADFTDMDAVDVAIVMADNHDRKRCYSKLAEECIELAEVCIKMANKTPELEPPVDKVIEEAGDILFRLSVVAEIEDRISGKDLLQEVYERHNEKAWQVLQWLKKQKMV